MHGLPIRPAFAETRAPQRVLRKRLGMDRHLPAVLLVGAQKLVARSAGSLTWSSSCDAVHVRLPSAMKILVRRV